METLAEAVKQAILDLFKDKCYIQNIFDIFQRLFLPSEASADPEVAWGIVATERYMTIESTSQQLGFQVPSARDCSDTTVEADCLMRGLKKVPESWTRRPGGNKVILELANLAADIMRQFRYGRQSQLVDLVGGITTIDGSAGPV